MLNSNRQKSFCFFFFRKRRLFFFLKKKEAKKTFSCADAVLLVGVLWLGAGPCWAAPRRVTVLLDWFVNPDHAPILVALQAGAFAALGLDVVLVPPADPMMPPKLVAAGHGDIAVTDQPHFMEQIAAGLPLRRVGALIDRPLASLMVLRSSGVGSVAGLRGKRIGIGSGDIERVMVGAMLRHAGAAAADVSMVNVGEQLVVSLLGHHVDAVTIYRNFEPFEVREQGGAPVLFNYEDNGVPGYDEMIFVAAADKARDAGVVGFLRGVAQGVAALRADPEGCWRRFVAAYPDLDNAVNRSAWFATLPYFAADPFAVDVERYEGFARFLAAAGAIGEVPRVGDYLVEK